MFGCRWVSKTNISEQLCEKAGVYCPHRTVSSYHRLCSAIAQVGGKKELTGRLDLDIAINHQRARLIAHAILSLLTSFAPRGNETVLTLFTARSSVAC